MVIGHLEPKKVMQYFEEISAIPRPSKSEKQISDFLVAFAKSKNFEVIQDEFLNVIIKKPATPGYENSAPIMLQGHMDMVAEANQGTNHDFHKDPIKLCIDGNFIRATGTTLGADNGIAVAMMLAILDTPDLKHPALEMFITSDEESGMTGAIHFDPKHFKARQMINIDTEEVGEIYVSCAGGVKTELSIPFSTVPVKGEALQISIRGLSGGHSGMQINEQHGNSNKLLARTLSTILQTLEFNLVSIKGGSKENAIPREADGIIMVDSSAQPKIEKIIADLNTIYKKEYSISDPNVNIEMKSIQSTTPMMNLESSRKIIESMNIHGYGVKSMSLSIPGLVQTSLNLGVVVQKEDSVVLIGMLRSSVKSELDDMVLELQSLAKLAGGKLAQKDPYPGWEYNPHSKLRDVAIQVGKVEFGKDVEVKAVHAGLECGIIGEKFPDGFDAISIGPNIYAPHTPEEHLDIASVKVTYEWLLKILASAK